MTLQCLLVDDEPRAHVVLKSHIDKIKELEVIHSTTSSVEAFSYLQSHAVDLLFLDIEMPELSGLELLDALQNPPKVIITSAHSEFALDSYNFDVVDYLLKPIPFSRFLKAVQKVIQQTKGSEETVAEEADAPAKDHFFIKEDGVNKRIDFDKILYVNSYGNYLKIFTTEDKYMIAETMKHIEDTLPAHQFQRIHKSYLVSLSKIEKVQGRVVYISQQEIPVGNAYRQSLMEKLG